MKIRVKPFGQAKGALCQLYTLENQSGAFVTITNYSGAITGLSVPDKKGKLDNVVLGFDDVKNYVKNPGYLGALIGPVGNRISGASFEYKGEKYAFTPNEGGTTLLHSGDFGFHAGAWDATCEATGDEARLILRRAFPHAETGFPGSLDATVTYTFNEKNELKIHYEISSDAPSFVSPTNHAYFNISGTGSKHVKSVEKQKMQIFADTFTRADAMSLPIDAAPVDGTPLDLRQPTEIAKGFALEQEVEQLKNVTGFDHNFILSGDVDAETGLRLAARVTDDKSGRVMRVYTDMPCVQFYAANHLNRWNAAEKRFYKPHQALCLETQCAPDSIHHVGEFGFQLCEITPEKPFSSTTVYAFGVE